MTISELHIQIDLQSENRIDILEDIAQECDEGYIFVDSNDGHCYLFDKNGNEDDIKKIKSIGDYAFWSDQSLKSIIIPDSVESIGDGAFAYCNNLKSIVIPDSVKNIKQYAFLYCKSLKSVEIPDFVESIGNNAFWNCKKLKSVSFKVKTMKQIKAMENYPFGIVDESIIRCI